MDSDPDLEIIEKDSGMSSLGGSKDETPERRAVIEDVTEEDEIVKPNAIVNVKGSIPDESENFDDEPDETLSERLWGLTEMFPEFVRSACEVATDLTFSTTKSLYSFTCNASWIFFTSSMILFAPVLLETERAQMAELEKSQERKVLLGPGAISGSGNAPGMPALPPMAR